MLDFACMSGWILTGLMLDFGFVDVGFWLHGRWIWLRDVRFWLCGRWILVCVDIRFS